MADEDQRVTLTMTTETDGLELLLHEAAGLVKSRAVPDDLMAEIHAIADDEDLLVQGEPTCIDGRLHIPYSPSTRLLSAMERLRACEPA